MDHVILVDEHDNTMGTMEKMEAHQKGVLHRAFSVLLFNSKGEMLIQKRSVNKYHSAGLWTNTCCSHPRPGEELADAIRRRLQEELGIDAQPAFSHKLLYKAHLANNLIEHELDHVFIGQFNGEPVINKEEVEDWKFASLEWLRKDAALNPDRYSHWFKIILTHEELMRAIV